MLFCPNCHMLKRHCMCGNSSKSDKSEKSKIIKEVSDSSHDVSKVSKKPDYELKSDKDNVSNISSSHSDNPEEMILSEISDAIKKGYKFIVVESNDGNSDIAVKLTEDFKSSVILTANEKSTNWYNKRYHLGKNKNVHLMEQKEFIDEYKNIEKSDLLIIDDSHRLDENIINSFSYTVNLSDFSDLTANFNCSINDLPKKDYSRWLEFIDYLSLEDKWIKRVVSAIRQNPENWICFYNDFNLSARLSFYPLDVGYIADKFFFTKGEVCILISPTIIDFDLFAHELSLDTSQTYFISDSSSVNLYKNRIYARKTANKYDNLNLLIPYVKEILDKHKNEKGLILTNSSNYFYNIRSQIRGGRLLVGNNYYRKLKEFEKISDSVMITDFLEDGIEFPYNQCKFQIIVKQKNYPYNERSICKNEESGWYSYKQVINLINKIKRPITSQYDYCTTYILDEGILKTVSYDINHNKFIPEYIIDLIADLDMKNYGYVSGDVKKQFGVYYLFEYDSSRKNEKILEYKDYNKENPNTNVEAFNCFTEKLMEAISELSDNIIDVKLNKLALVGIPSSTVQRDRYATVNESINQIEKWYEEGKTYKDFNCKKEIINCGNLLNRVRDVDTSHKGKRVSYIRHIDSIGCRDDDILKEDDVAFVIVDDVSTRGTIMNVCEDILIDNGVKKENIYKFALFKTVW